MATSRYSSSGGSGGGFAGNSGGEQEYGIHRGRAVGLLLGLVAVIGFVLFLFVWFGCRIEPPSGHCAVLIRKDGIDIPADQIIALSEDQKGIQLNTLSEGRYFYNPFFWDSHIVPSVHLSEGEVGVLVRRFGNIAPPGQFVVPEKSADGKTYRGVIDEPLRPGTYRINPFAYDVLKVPAVKVNPGEVGIVTLRFGKDPTNENTVLVSPGERGVQPEPLRPGTYYLNPFIYRVDVVSVQSHKTEFEISFLSKDGFRFPVKGVVEWAQDEKFAPEVFVLIGDSEDIVQKVILRSALSMSRIQGSKYSSADILGGVARKAFQDEFYKHIMAESAKKNILVKAALITEIAPPEQIKDPIRERQIAVQTRDTYAQQIERAKSDALVAQQKKMQEQLSRVVASETLKANAVQKANKEMQVSVIGAERDLDVSKKDLEAAEKQAQAIVALGQGDADVVRYTKLAEASALQAVIAPFGSGANYAQTIFLTKVAPNVSSIMATTDGPLGAPFRTLSNIESNKK